MLSFKLWLEESTFGKVSLYPPLYTQFINYPPQDVVKWSADAIVYLDPEDVKFKALSGVFKPYIWHSIYKGKST